MTHDQRQQRRHRIIEMLKAGLPPVRVARETGLSTTYIMQIARVMGLVKRRPSLATMLRVVALLKSGQKQSRIARELGVSDQYVTEAKSAAIGAGLLTEPTNLRGPGRPSRAAPTARAMKSSGAKDA